MKKIFLLLTLLLNFTIGHACLNYYYSIDNAGHFHDAEGLKKAFNTNFNLKSIEADLKKMEVKLKSNKDYKLLSDYAVLLLKAGRTKEAVDLLEQLSLKHPDEYQIAANLGTAYELAGNVEKALEYIKRGIELNPNAHAGSEWVHMKLLETKLKLEKDANYLDKHSVLNLSDKQKKDEKVRDQLMIQIRERFPFCKGPDPIMASLMMDVGDCYASTLSVEFAKASYEIALHYYGAPAEIVDPKINHMKELLRQFTNLDVSSGPGRSTELHNYLRKEGEHNRMSGIKYKTLLNDNNPSNYAINWSDIQYNTDSLLAYAQIERVLPEPTEIEIKDVKPKAKAFTGKSETTINLWVYLLIVGICLGAGGWFLLRKKNHKSDSQF